MRLITLLVVCVTAVNAAPQALRFPSSERIVGGSLTTIYDWPYKANVMMGPYGWFYHICGGTIINNRSVLTAAHCVRSHETIYPASWYRLRLGSTFASGGGVLHNVAENIIYPYYDYSTLDSDIAIIRSETTFIYSDVLQQGRIAGPDYKLLDDEEVWVTGWGAIWEGGPGSEHLREVQVWTINHEVCSQRYGGTLTANMMCTGYLHVGGRDACQGDSGGPVFHNRVVVGITSWGDGCGRGNYPGVNTRVSRFTSWIQENV